MIGNTDTALVDIQLEEALDLQDLIHTAQTRFATHGLLSKTDAQTLGEIRERVDAKIRKRSPAYVQFINDSVAAMKRNKNT